MDYELNEDADTLTFTLKADISSIKEEYKYDEYVEAATALLKKCEEELAALAKKVAAS